MVNKSRNIIANVCPKCREIFPTVAGARRHYNDCPLLDEPEPIEEDKPLPTYRQIMEKAAKKYKTYDSYLKHGADDYYGLKGMYSMTVHHRKLR